MASTNIAGTLRRSLLIKVISKPALSKEDVASVIELTASKVSPNSVAVLMTNPLDYGKRESFSQSTEQSIEEVTTIEESLTNVPPRRERYFLSGRSCHSLRSRCAGA